jgi:hypothetical protein
LQLLLLELILLLLLLLLLKFDELRVVFPLVIRAQLIELLNAVRALQVLVKLLKQQGLFRFLVVV